MTPEPANGARRNPKVAATLTIAGTFTAIAVLTLAIEVFTDVRNVWHAVLGASIAVFVAGFALAHEFNPRPRGSRSTKSSVRESSSLSKD